MNGKRWHWIAILLAGSPVYSHAAPSCQRSDMPNWAIKAILAYPKPNERPAMLVAALAEYYDTSSIAAVDVDTVLVELAPSMLKAKTSDELRANIGRTMALFHCGSSNAVAAVAAVAPTAQKPTAAPGRDGAVVASLPVAKPADGSLKALPTKSLDGLADSADTESRSDQLDTLAERLV